MFGDPESLSTEGAAGRAVGGEAGDSDESPEARLVRGGFPTLLVQPSARRRRAWLSQYIDVIASRDLVDTLEARRPELARPLLDLAAARTGRLLNIAEMSRSLSVNVPTLRTYLHHLELLFVVERLAPWSTNRSHRIVKTPKLHVTDSGLCSALLGVDADTLRTERELFGQLLETWVVQELRRQATWHEHEHRFFHFRDRDGHEVDLVIERYGRAVAGVEVKASATVRSADMRGLQRLAGLAGDRFVGGTLVYLGDHVLTLGDNLRAVPLSAVWDPAPAR